MPQFPAYDLPPKLNVSTFFPLTGGCSEGLEAFRFFFKKSMDQPCKVANPARGQLNRENEYFPVRVRA